MTALSAVLAPFAVWVLSVLLLLSPPAKREAFQKNTERVLPAEQKETTEEGELRYASIAADVTAVVHEDGFVPLFPGKQGREKTVALVLAVAQMESGFRKDVDLGEGKLGRGDHGRSWCLLQVQAGTTGTVPSGNETTRAYTGKDLVTDRKKCFRAGIEMMRLSLAACKDAPMKHRLAVYASGSCDKGLSESEVRMALAARVMRLAPLPAPIQALPAPETKSSGASSSLAHAAP